MNSVSAVIKYTIQRGSIVVMPALLVCLFGVAGCSLQGQAQSVLITNTASVASATVDPVMPNNTGETTDPLNVPSTIDLEITKTGSAPNLKPSQTISFILTAKNKSTASVQNALVVDTLPASLVLQSAEVAGISIPVSGNTVSYTIPLLDPGQNVVITVVAQVPNRDSAVTETNIATISPPADMTDSNTQNNSSSYQFSITPYNADLRIAKTASKAITGAGDTFEYTLMYKNLGPDSARGVQITDTLPSQVTYLSSKSEGRALSPQLTGSVLTFEVGDLNPDQEGTITIAVQTNDNSNGAIVNIARITSSTPDQNTANNQASVTTLGITPQLVRTGGLAFGGLSLAGIGLFIITKRFSRKSITTA